MREQRPWNGPDPPAALYLYSPDRKGDRPAAYLANFKGILQVDGYAGFERLTPGGEVTLAACWAHARRKFYEIQQATASPIATEALARIATLYNIEKEIRGRSPEECQETRLALSAPLITETRIWLEVQLARIPPKRTLAIAIRYALSRWTALARFLEDGRIELDNNAVERTIRPVTLGRKNHLFAGSDGGAQRQAVIVSLIETAKLNSVEPHAWLKDVLTRMTGGYPMSRIDELRPWNWKPAPSQTETACKKWTLTRPPR